MKKRKRYLLVLTLLPILTVSGIYLNYLNGQGDNSVFQAEGSSVRNFDHLLEKKTSFKYRGSQIGSWQEFNGKLYVLDQVEQQFFILGETGEILDTLGEKGVAPWENQQIRRFHVNGSGIYSVDNSLMTIKQMRHDGSFEFYKKRQEPFWDALHLKDDSFLILNDESEMFGFYPWSASTGKTGKLIRLDSLLEIDRPKNLHVVFEGEMVQGELYNYYVCSRAGRFFVFSPEGDYLGNYSTIDNTKEPEVIERKLNNMTIYERQPDEIINYAAASDGENLFILSTIAFGPTETMTVDVYTPRGEYSFSFSVPNHNGNFPVNLMIGKKYLWFLYEDLYITGYKLEKVVL